MVLGELCLNLTIVIPTRNRTKQVRWLVHKLRPLNSELIVVDDYSQRPVMVDGATVVRNPRRLGSGESRNVGCRLAKSNWLLLIDDDLAPSAGLVRFIDRLLPTLKCKDIIGFRIVGSNKVGSRSITYRFTGLFRVLNILFGVDISPRTGPSRFLPSAMLFQTSFFISLGGFDSQIYGGNGFREESDLQHRARKAGGKLTYIENPFFQHLNISGGHQKGLSSDGLDYMRNHTIFATRSGHPASLVKVAAFGAYCMANGIRLSTLVKGITQGIVVVLKG